ncbi:unnamed protein product [Linum trigynum]|uniref:Uncharacterized protein n=1 Tax=Linum trigynum TaxID=586398 RepID=A0AAV2FG50_9ROSI
MRECEQSTALIRMGSEELRVWIVINCGGTLATSRYAVVEPLATGLEVVGGIIAASREVVVFAGGRPERKM